MGNFICSRAPYSLGCGPIWPKVKLVRDCMPDLIICKSEKDLIEKKKQQKNKRPEKRWRHPFPHYESMGAFCCHGDQSFDPICPKNIMQPFPHANGASLKILSRLANWPQKYSSLKVWTDGRLGRRIIAIV